MTDSDLTEPDGIDDNRAQALSLAHRAVQFLESKQASGAIIILTDESGVFLAQSACTPMSEAMGDVANICSELGDRFRKAWYEMHTDAQSQDAHLGLVEDDPRSEEDNDDG